MFLVNNLGGNHHVPSTSSSSGSGSDSAGGHFAGMGSSSDGPGGLMKEIDFKARREAFRSLDTENLGMLSMAEVK
jgi:hypothetical protein